MTKKKVVIIGAGPAGLTAAYELLTRTEYEPIILEATSEIGGLSRTVCYKGNRMDIGGHRFFSKSDRVMEWWKKMMPIETDSAKLDENKDGKKPLLMIRSRLSRILFLRKFFDYPISLSLRTIKNLGLWRMFKIALSYLKICIKPIKKEKHLEDFFINRFGNELYKTFFKDYTHKVWGVPCTEIKPEWGAQRIKGVSIAAALKDAWKKIFNKKEQSIDQKNVETSLIEQFLYPQLGPGQMWELVAQKIEDLGGKIYFNHKVIGVEGSGGAITAVTALDTTADQTVTFEADSCISTMPIKNLIHGLHGFSIPEMVSDIASQLTYRDFITVGLLIDHTKGEKPPLLSHKTMKDNWIYIQESDVKIGRLQIFNNWSPYMVADQEKTWVGLEYFCNEDDELWSKGDDEFIQFAIQELKKIGLIEEEHVVDGTIIRVPKAYPAYFGSYAHFDLIKQYLNRIKNLYLIGRNGMHKYNNQDHAMLTAMTLVDNLVEGVTVKDSLWSINTEQTYHESKQK